VASTHLRSLFMVVVRVLRGCLNGNWTRKDQWWDLKSRAIIAPVASYVIVPSFTTAPSGGQNVSALEGVYGRGPLILDPELSAELVDDQQKSWLHADESQYSQYFFFIRIKDGPETWVYHSLFWMGFGPRAEKVIL
jgi:hypothetical protein